MRNEVRNEFINYGSEIIGAKMDKTCVRNWRQPFYSDKLIDYTIERDKCIKLRTII